MYEVRCSWCGLHMGHSEVAASSGICDVCLRSVVMKHFGWTEEDMKNKDWNTIKEGMCY